MTQRSSVAFCLTGLEPCRCAPPNFIGAEYVVALRSNLKLKKRKPCVSTGLSLKTYKTAKTDKQLDARR